MLIDFFIGRLLLPATGLNLPVSIMPVSISKAQVAELVDAPDLGSGAARRGGSSPFLGTILELIGTTFALLYFYRCFLRHCYAANVAIKAVFCVLRSF